MVFRILDASAFYAGIPFGSQAKNYTTSLVFEEIKHIKKDQDALNILLETKRLTIIDPDVENVNFVKKMAKSTGDFHNLSNEDISTLALALQLQGEIITDDFAVSNVAKQIDLEVSPIMTSGIKKIGKWRFYCPGCRKNFSKITECPLCGNSLRRKLIKTKSSSLQVNK